ncbi:hypothetical protein [Actinomadura montaniterrae]|uniref:hypothetical protein n=1 Tax=Actinomadura montaniterrae TaxID=1803903 RepID=UPI00178C1B77|nr:hypothetical protein [Actinomadura montaniterrae]
MPKRRVYPPRFLFYYDFEDRPSRPGRGLLRDLGAVVCGCAALPALAWLAGLLW